MTPLPDYQKLAAARALVGWRLKTLASHLHASTSEVHLLEVGVERVRPRLLAPAIDALQRAGVEFHDRGVSLREAA